MEKIIFKNKEKTFEINSEEDFKNFCFENNLTKEKVEKLLRGEAKTHRGFSLATAPVKVANPLEEAVVAMQIRLAELELRIQALEKGQKPVSAVKSFMDTK